MKLIADLVSSSRRSLTADEIRQRREVARYRYVHAVPLVAAEVFADIATRFHYEVNGNWRRARCAALTAACLELEQAHCVVSGGRARYLVAERYHRLPLGRDRKGKRRYLALSQLTLWRAFTRWLRSDRNSPAVLDLRSENSGRRPKGWRAAV